MFIFAYGSNMLLQKLKVNVPSARKVANACLREYRFAFNKTSKKDGSAKGNIIPTGNSEDTVWGVLFDIQNRDKQALDREEGLGYGYNEIAVSIATIDNKIVHALAYIADDSAIQDILLHFDWYRDMVVIGAAHNELPESYIDELKKFPFKADNDEIRRHRKYSIIQTED